MAVRTSATVDHAFAAELLRATLNRDSLLSVFDPGDGTEVVDAAGCD
jgi:hypothetical protein